ncbi:MAG: methylated-DNA-[protein]-cysteine S-methyltransferase [Mycobacterium sp.]|nr:methylated-DNA-[protein]-cysteine S-methyltransferase [Mycobacterium sp.]
MSHRLAVATWHTVIGSALGELTLVRDAEGLRGLYFPHHWYRPDPATFGPRRDQGFDETTLQLTEYLAGARREFELALVARGDPLQIAVWRLIADIPYGATSSYGELAMQLGGGITAQQTGAAIGRNPLSIVVPCHRVVGRNGKLTGYAGGIARKSYLLDLERMPVQAALMSGLS